MFEGWGGWHVAELAAVPAAGGDVDDVITEALRVKLGLAHDSLGRVCVYPEAVLRVALAVHRAIPAEEAARWIGGKAAIDFAAAVRTDETRLPEVDALSVLAFGLPELVERGLAIELFDGVAIVCFKFVGAIEPAVFCVPGELHGGRSCLMSSLNTKRSEPAGVKVVLLQSDSTRGKYLRRFILKAWHRVD